MGRRQRGPGAGARGDDGLPRLFGVHYVTPAIYVDVFYINGPQLFGFLFIISAYP